MSANEDPRTFCLRLRAEYDVRSLREQIAAAKDELRRAEKRYHEHVAVLTNDLRTAERCSVETQIANDPAWPVLAAALSSTNQRADRNRDLLLNFVACLTRTGSLSERQREVLDAIAYEIEQTVEERALAFPCPRCGEPVGEPCRGSRRPVLKIPHDERLDFLPQNAAVVAKRRDRSYVVACPECRAPVGRPCVGAKGLPVEHPHPRREYATVVR